MDALTSTSKIRAPLTTITRDETNSLIVNAMRGNDVNSPVLLSKYDGFRGMPWDTATSNIDAPATKQSTGNYLHNDHEFYNRASDQDTLISTLGPLLDLLDNGKHFH